MAKGNKPPTPPYRHLGHIPVMALTGGKIHLISVRVWEGSGLFPGAICGNRASNNGWSAMPVEPDTPDKAFCSRCLNKAREASAK